MAAGSPQGADPGAHRDAHERRGVARHRARGDDLGDGQDADHIADTKPEPVEQITISLLGQLADFIVNPDKHLHCMALAQRVRRIFARDVVARSIG